MIENVEEGLDNYKRALLEYQEFCEKNNVGPTNEGESMIQIPFSSLPDTVDEERRKREIALRGVERAFDLGHEEVLGILKEFHVTRYDAIFWLIW